MKPGRRWLLSLLLPFAMALAEAPSTFSGPFDDLVLCHTTLAALADRVKNNRFNVLRGLLDYRETFGGNFWLTLVRMKPGEQWLDAGSGAGVAMAEYQTGRQLSPFKTGRAKETIFPIEDSFPKERASTRGVVVALPEEGASIESAVREFAGTGKHTVLEGRKIEGIPAEELGKSRLITDYFGPVTYSTHLGGVIDKYLEIATPDADIYLKVSGGHHLIELRDGRRLPLLEYLKLRLRGHAVTSAEPESDSVIHIKLSPEGVRKLPKLVLKEILTSGLPSYYFREE